MRLVLTTALALLFALPASAQKILPAPLRVMPMGDSITEGGDGTGGYRRPLFDLLTTSLGAQPNFVGERNMRQSDPADFVDMDEDGFSLYRIDQIASGEGVWNAPSVEQRLHDWDPAIVLLHAGTNDAQQDFCPKGCISKQLPDVITRLDDLISRIAAFNPAIYIVVAQIIPANAPASQTTMNYIVRLNKQIPRMVARHQALGDRVSMVDMYTPMLSHPNPDGIHPAAEGYGVMANVWFAGIQALGATFANPDPGRFANLHQVDNWSSVSSVPWTLSPNLIRAGSPTLESAVTTDYKGQRSPALLNDGVLTATTDDKDDTSTTTFTLNTAQNPNGFDMNEIRSDAGQAIAADGDERANQSYDVWWSSVDAPDVYAQLGSFHHIMVNRAERGSQVDLTHADGSPLARRVARIQFRFTQPPQRQFGFYGIDARTGYREIEVLGAASPALP